MSLGEVDRDAVMLNRLRQSGRGAGGVEHDRRCLSFTGVDRGGQEIQQREARAVQFRTGPRLGKDAGDIEQVVAVDQERHAEL